VFPTFAIGGAQARLATIANALGPAFRHEIVSLDGRLEARARLSPALSVTIRDAGAAKRALVRSVIAYRSRLGEWQPDLVLTYNWGAIEFALATLLTGTPHIHVMDGFGPEEVSRRLRRRLIIRRIALARSLVVVPSRKLLDVVCHEIALPEAQVRYIPNGIDLTRFTPARETRAGGVVIGTIAALRAEKNLPRLLQAFARADLGPDVRLMIVGDGECRGELVTLTAALGLSDRVEFTGHHEDVTPFLARFDLLALSSDTEQMPMVVLEAMAAGLPIVATDVGDIRTMVAPENAPFIRGRHFTDLAAGLRRLGRDAEARARLGIANRAAAEARFDQARMLAAWQDVLQERASRRGP
jgi:glycosyltransferase involved in cell wall biosynthesis